MLVERSYVGVVCDICGKNGEPRTYRDGTYKSPVGWIRKPFFNNTHDYCDTCNKYIKAEKRKVKRLLKKLDRFYDGRLVTRIQELLNICEEEGTVTLSKDSLASFIAYANKIGFKEYPDLVITQDGNIRAKESDGYDDFFFREFLYGCKIKLLYKKYVSTISFVK